jgi:arginine decarboxylase
MKHNDSLPILIVHDRSESGITVRTAISQIIKELEASGVEVIEAENHEDGLLALRSHPELGAVLLGWAESAAPADSTEGPSHLLAVARQRFDGLPVILMTEGLSVEDLSPEVAACLAGAIWLSEDTPEWDAGHIRKEMEHYRARLLPPFFGALSNYVAEYKYGWHTPGHMGGLAFLKSPVGRLFFDFVGETALRADLSSSVPALGSILEHVGVVREAESRAARAFGADTTYFVTNGTTMSNQIVFRSLVTPGDVVLLDRNCHKSILNAVIQTGGVPVWMLPVRNRYGMIGPINVSEMQPETIDEKLRSHPLLRDRDEAARRPRLAVLTNSTYDGTMYNAERVIERLGAVTDTVHFDEAWIPYAAFHPVYGRHFAMTPVPPVDAVAGGAERLPTVVSTMSTHKMLAALSQASMIHIRQGRAPLPEDRFNEAFMMHTSTSPQYLIVASLDVATKMMEGRPGRALMDDAIGEAVAFRRELAMVRDRLADQLEWWFDIWQPSEVEMPGAESGTPVPFADADDEFLVNTQAVWEMRPGQSWHGFEGVEDGYTMLDPVKVTVVTPGLGPDGSPTPSGIPAAIVSALLGERGVVSEKTGFYSLLFLFSIGVTKGKSGTLLTELFDFKRLLDENAPLAEAMPGLVASHPARYEGVGLRDLALEMHEFLSAYDTATMQEAIYQRLPEPAMSPAEAFGHLVRGQVEHVPLEQLHGRVTAVLCVLYPPGIPVVVPGERFDTGAQAIINYLRLFEEWDNRFPGFESEVQGIVKDTVDGRISFSVNCVQES